MALFDSVAPIAFLVVQIGASPANDCSPARPCASIHKAVQMAKPGTAILVRTGVYTEAVKFPSRKGGTPDRPIWLVSADGPGAAKIVPATGTKAAIQGLGVKNIAVMGFEIVGAENGIQVGMSGDPGKDPSFWNELDRTVSRVLIRDNIIYGQTRGDGVKVSQAEQVEVTDNKVWDVADQCVDFVAVKTGVISRNDCAGSRQAAAIFAKAGSQDIEISHNYVHDIPARKIAGISLGGYGRVPFYSWPDLRDFEARRLSVHDNKVERTNGAPISVLGARDSQVYRNFLDASESFERVAITVSHGSPGKSWAWPSNIDIRDNVITGQNTLIRVDRSRAENGERNVDAARDNIVLQKIVGDPDAIPQTGPRNFPLWRGQDSYPVVP